MVPFAREKIDDQGRLTDPRTGNSIADLVQALIAWAGKLK